MASTRSLSRIRRILIDTGAFVSKEIGSDQYHEESMVAWSEIGESTVELVSTEHILDESATLIARRSTYAFAAEWGEDLSRLKSIRWLRAAPDDWTRAWINMRKFAEHGVSFTDCISFVLAKREGIRDVFGFDQHFDYAGFRLWPK